MLNRKTIHITGIRLSYFESNESAQKTIFFFHGNGNSANLWKAQLNNVLLEDYKLIAFDLPSHGESGALKDGDCNLLFMGSLMARCVLELCGDMPYLLCGLSLGGNVIAEMLAHPVHPDALVIIGSNFVGQGIRPEDIISDRLLSKVLYSNEATALEVQTYLNRAILGKSREHLQLLLSDYRKTDPGFRMAFSTSVAAGRYSDEIQLLQKYGRPILFCFGKEDIICSIDVISKLIPYTWNNAIVQIPESGHLVTLDQAEVFNMTLRNFIEEIYT